jgi:hypothetical protein
VFVCLQLAEEQERDREAARIAAESYRREREMQQKEAREARQRKKEAHSRWEQICASGSTALTVLCVCRSLHMHKHWL